MWRISCCSSAGSEVSWVGDLKSERNRFQKCAKKTVLLIDTFDSRT
jgi:hypothetical protein